MDDAERKLVVKEMKHRRGNFDPCASFPKYCSYSFDHRDMKASDALKRIAAKILLDEAHSVYFEWIRDDEYGSQSVTVTMFYDKKSVSN